jgi:hypothetical protein
MTIQVVYFLKDNVTYRETIQIVYALKASVSKRDHPKHLRIKRH